MIFHFRFVRGALAAWLLFASIIPASIAAFTHEYEFVAGFEAPPGLPQNDRLTLSPDGYLWGTTLFGGTAGVGAVFKVRTDGTGSELVHSLAPDSFDGSMSSRDASGLEPDGLGFLWGTSNNAPYTSSSPMSGLVNDGAGFLWGTTGQGGTNNASTVYKMHAATGIFTHVASFSGSGPVNNGRMPRGRLASDGAGNFWGVTNEGGASNLGTVFKVNTTTGALTNMVNFTGNGETAKGAAPLSGLAYDGQGFMWGTTSAGGAGDFGTVFKVNVGTGELTTVLEFTKNEPTNKGRFPCAALIADHSGRMWGSTQYGGSDDAGTFFKIEASTGVLTTIHECPDRPNNFGGRSPTASLIDGGDGYLYGTTLYGGKSGLGTVIRISLETSLVSTVYELEALRTSFRGSAPRGGFVNDGNGWLWSTTDGGGEFGGGTIFKLDPISGRVVTVAQFNGANGTKGISPLGTLVSDGQGSFWGTTLLGGANNNGTVYKVNSTTGELTTVVDFPANTSLLGANPYVGLTLDANGQFWGTTYFGGAFNHGTIFKIDRSTGVATKVHDFAKNGTSNPGSKPRAALCADGAGFLWGTTTEGGTGNYGTVFKIHAVTGAFTHVLAFSSNGLTNKGATPRGALIHDGTGTLWGATYAGGSWGHGTVYKLDTTTGILTTVSELFASGGSGQRQPAAPLFYDGAGTIWGTTSWGGPSDDGTVFKVPTGTGDVVPYFAFSRQLGYGGHPGYGGLTKAADGNLYGVLMEAGPYGGGAIYRLRFGPTPITQEATSITPDRATIRGKVWQNGNATTATLEWGTSPTLSGSTLIPQTLSGSIYDSAEVSAVLTGLQPETTYYYRINGTNAANPITQRGVILSFTTPPNAPPSVTLKGSNPLTLEASLDFFTDPGATATDLEDGAITPVLSNYNVLPHIPGSYSVEWKATDHLGSSTTATRTIVVQDTTAPAIEGNFAPKRVVTGSLLADYREQAATNDVVGVTNVSQSPAPGTPLEIGTTQVTITAADAAGNSASFTFTVTVTPPNVLPTVTLNGSNPLTVEAATSFTDPGATATDPEDGGLAPIITANTVLPKKPGSYVVSWTATDLDGGISTATRAVVVQDTIAPSIQGSFAPTRVANGTLLLDYRSQAVTNDVAGVATLTQNPAPGTPLSTGSTDVTVTAADASGNSASVTFTVVVRLASPELETVVAGRGLLPGAGIDPRIAEGSKWADLGSPAISDTGAMAFTGKWAGDSRSAQTGTGIFVDGNLLVKAGDPVPGAGVDGVPQTAVFKTFREPVISGNRVAFIATYAPAGGRGVGTAVFSNARAGVLEIIARIGGPAPDSGDAIFKSFANVSIQQGAFTEVIFTADLAGLNARSGVNASNNSGAWSTAADGSLSKVIRKGDPGFAPEESIESFQLLRALNGSAGHGRGHISAGRSLFQVTLRYAGSRAKRDALVLATAGTLTEIARNGQLLNSTLLPLARWNSQGLPSASASGEGAAVLGTLQADGTSVVNSEVKGIFQTENAGETWEPVARLGGDVEGFSLGVRYSQLYDPVHSSTKAALAFAGTAKAPKLPASSNDGLWWQSGTDPMQLIAREGEQPSCGPTGAIWKSFSTLAFPGGDGGPIFIGNLKAGFPMGVDRVTANNDTRLYGIDSFGALRELLREGQPIDGGTIKSFTLLKAALGSAGASRSFNSEGLVTVLATLKDGTKAILRITIP